MSKKELKGVFCLVPTVFTEKGDLDLEACRENFRYLEEAGMHGIIACASVGQYYLMNDDEFKSIAKAVREECKEMACLVGTHFQNTRDCIARTQYAEKIGADGVFILPPYYSNWLYDDACYAHYKAVHDATSEIQIMVYNYEQAGFTVNIELWDRLLEDCPRITAVKECTPLVEMSELARKYADRLNILAGAEPAMYPYMIMGAVGTMGVYATAFPKFILKFFDACANKSWDEALRYHQLLNTFVQEWRTGGYQPGNKGIATAAGLKGGFQRPPYHIWNTEEKDIEFFQKWLKRLDEAVVAKA